MNDTVRVVVNRFVNGTLDHSKELLEPLSADCNQRLRQWGPYQHLPTLVNSIKDLNHDKTSMFTAIKHDPSDVNNNWLADYQISPISSQHPPRHVVSTPQLPGAPTLQRLYQGYTQPQYITPQTPAAGSPTALYNQNYNSAIVPPSFEPSRPVDGASIAGFNASQYPAGFSVQYLPLPQYQPPAEYQAPPPHHQGIQDKMVTHHNEFFGEALLQHLPPAQNRIEQPQFALQGWPLTSYQPPVPRRAPTPETMPTKHRKVDSGVRAHDIYQSRLVKPLNVSDQFALQGEHMGTESGLSAPAGGPPQAQAVLPRIVRLVPAPKPGAASASSAATETRKNSNVLTLTFPPLPPPPAGWAWFSPVKPLKDQHNHLFLGELETLTPPLENRLPIHPQANGRSFAWFRTDLDLRKHLGMALAVAGYPVEDDVPVIHPDFPQSVGSPLIFSPRDGRKNSLPFVPESAIKRGDAAPPSQAGPARQTNIIYLRSLGSDEGMVSADQAAADPLPADHFDAAPSDGMDVSDAQGVVTSVRLIDPAVTRADVVVPCVHDIIPTVHAVNNGGRAVKATMHPLHDPGDRYTSAPLYHEEPCLLLVPHERTDFSGEEEFMLQQVAEPGSAPLGTVSWEARLPTEEEMRVRGCTDGLGAPSRAQLRAMGFCL